MRLIVFFDLPVVTEQERKQYVKFRKYLLGQGFIMVQESVYSKITLNNAGSETVISNLRNHKPKSGNVQILKVTERQYQDIEFLIGVPQKEILDTVQRLVVL